MYVLDCVVSSPAGPSFYGVRSPPLNCTDGLVWVCLSKNEEKVVSE